VAGDTTNVAVWGAADVFIGSLTAPIPSTNAAFTLNATSGGTGTTNWDFVGILDGSAGFAESQAFDSTDFNGWGYGVVASSKKNLAITRTFTCLEENLITLALRYDASGVTNTSGNLAGTLKGRNLNNKFRVAFETRATGVVERYISNNYALIDAIGDATYGEDNLASFAVTVKVFPTVSGSTATYWNYYKGA
jgi:hypothetical protein